MIAINTTNEKELLEQLRIGDQKAFEELYHRYSKRIYGNIYRLVKDPDLAQEFLQDVFLKIWHKREDLSTELSFRSYLFQISRNLVYNHFRKETIQIQVQNYLSSTLSELHTDEEDNLQYKQSKAIVDQVIEQLPAQRRKIYIMCKLEGRSYQEVSNLLGISTSTINDHIVKATKFLKDHPQLSDSALALLFMLSVLN